MSDNFTQIKNELIRNEKLTPNEKVVLFVLMTYGNCDEIFVGQKKLAVQSGMSRKLVMKAIEGLRKKRYLKTKRKVDRSTLRYELNTEKVVPISDKPVTKKDKACSQIGQGVVPKSDTSNKSISNKNIDKEPSAENIPYKKIIDRFNQECNGKFKHTTRDTQTKIRARWNEGFRYEDFEQAIIRAYAKYSSFSDNGKVNNMRPDVVFNGQMEKRLGWPLPVANKERPYDIEELKRIQKEKFSGAAVSDISLEKRT
jgi:uncharacterized phage protein (TIGR02220 family)